MRKSTIRTTTVLVTALAVAASLAACGSSGGGGGVTSGAPEGDDGGAGSGEQVTINWWAYAPDVMVADQWIKAFNEVYPNITVVYKNFENTEYKPALRPAIMSDDGPDVFNITPGGNAADKATWGEYAVDLIDIEVAAFGESWRDSLAVGFGDELTMPDGRLVAAPIGGVSSGFMWINQDLFDEVGAKVPTTYDEWVEACAAFHAAGKVCHTLGAAGGDGFAAEFFRPVIESIDQDFFIKACYGEASWDDPIMVQAFDKLRQMRDDGLIEPDAVGIMQYPDANNQFMSGQAGMVAMGTWYAQYAIKASAIASAQAAGVSDPVPFTMLPWMIPNVVGNDWAPALNTEADYGLAINAKSKHIEAAKTFVAWLTTTTEGQVAVDNALDLLPALIGGGPDWSQIELVNPEVQEAAIRDLFETAAASPVRRGEPQTPETFAALAVAVQEALATATPSADIAKTLAANATVAVRP